jgi:ABC-type lipoprotein export system ATPase subunit
MSSVNHRQPIISARGIHKVFPLGENDVHVLKGINIDIMPGQFVGIMGPSGSGKSTLMYILGALDKPTGGRVMVNGQQLDSMSEQDIAHFRGLTMGFIFQNYQLITTMTALENAALPGIFAGMPRDEREERAFKLLKMIQMDHRATYRPAQLSGGQQQRVAIARALFNNPPVIMGDEPTGALDSKTGEIVMRMLRTLSQKHGKTVIIVTHDPGIAAYADRMVLLRDGQIVDDYLTSERDTPLADPRASSEMRRIEASPPPPDDEPR